MTVIAITTKKQVVCLKIGFPPIHVGLFVIALNKNYDSVIDYFPMNALDSTL